MFLHFFIALFFGITSPNTVTNTSGYNTVQTTNTDGDTGGHGNGTGGEIGQNPPPKID